MKITVRVSDHDTKKRIQFILRRVILPFLLIYIGVGVIATIRNMSIKNHEYAAVLLSAYAIWEYDYWASPAAFIGAYIPWTYYFNNRDMKVKWFLRAKSIDLEKVIKDKDCQSIDLVGHGSLNSWQATDMLVTNLEVSDMVKGMPKKTGEWMQLSCGEEDVYSERMGELVMEKKERVYTYSKSITSYILETPILSLKRADGLIVLQGVERGRAFSLVISESTGELTAAVAREGFAVAVFGACTPLPVAAPAATTKR